MSVKVIVVLLAGIAVAVALVLFYGVLRPAGDPDDAESGVGGGLGWLAPRPTLAFDDLPAATCVHPETQTLEATTAAHCSIPLPSPAQLVLCTDIATTVVETDGSEYPVQRLTAEDMPCDDPPTVSIYDDDTVLTVSCQGVSAACAVRVVSSDG